jgi:hypothetical protein
MHIQNNLLKAVRLCLLLTSLPLVVFSKSWTNTDGRSFSGKLVSFSSKEVKIRSYSDGIIHSVKHRNLSKEDKLFLTNLRKAEYSKSNKFNRAKIPTFNQSDFRGGSSSCSPSSMMNFIVWWSSHYPEFHRGGNYEQNVKKIQRSLVNYSNSSGGGSSFNDLVDALEEYFIKYVKGYSFYYDIIYSPDLDQLKLHSSGSNAVILSTGWYERSGGKFKNTSNHATSLVGFSNNKLYLNTWGKQYGLEINEIPKVGLSFLKNTYAHWALENKRPFLQIKDDSYSKAKGDICFVNRILVVTPLKIN